MFKRPFDEGINTRNLLEIEKAKDIVKTEGLSCKTRDPFRRWMGVS